MDVRNSFFWSGIDRIASQVALLAIGVVLARLIPPEEYGLIALVTIFTALGQNMVNTGFRSSLIQAKELDGADCSTVLCSNILLSGGLMLILWLVAPLVAAFFDEPRLILIVQVLAIGLLFEAPSVVQQGLMTRSMKFREQTVAAICSNVLSGGIAIFMAFSGYQVWALVTLNLTSKFFLTIFLWYGSEWRPKDRPTKAAFMRLVPYGVKVAGCSLVQTLSQNLNVLLIGKFYPPAEVAFYQRADGYKAIPVNNFTLVTNRVLFPVFSKCQDDPAAFRNTFLRCLRVTAFVFFPLMACVMVNAEQIIRLLIGEKWLAAASLLKILAISGAFSPLLDLNGLALTSLGHAGNAFKVEVEKRILMTVILVLTIAGGTYYVAIGQSVGFLLATFVVAHYSRKYVGVGVLDQVVEWGPYAVLTTVAYFITALIVRHLSLPLSLMIVAQSVVLVACYGIIVKLLGLSGPKEVLSMMRGRCVVEQAG